MFLSAQRTFSNVSDAAMLFVADFGVETAFDSASSGLSPPEQPTRRRTARRGQCRRSVATKALPRILSEAEDNRY